MRHVLPAVRVVPTDDATFDAQIPGYLQAKSSIHFTPVAVARAAARLLATGNRTTVLDIGAGVGKFCIVAALAEPGLQFVGVERRKHLLGVARRLAYDWSVPNVRFVYGDAFALDWSLYDAFYLFNPFAEHVYGEPLAIDLAIEFGAKRYNLHVSSVLERLSCARVGTRVVTYHGFGASPPQEYDRTAAIPVGSDWIELWTKVRGGARERRSPQGEPGGAE